MSRDRTSIQNVPIALMSPLICYSWAKSRYFVGSKNTYIYQETNDRNGLLFLSWCTSSVFIKVQPPTLVFQCFTIYLFPAQAAGFSSS